MLFKTPQTMAGCTVFVEGLGFLGTSKEVTLPKLEFITWTSNSGMGEREIDTGLLKAMTATFVFEEYNKVYFEALVKRFNIVSNIYVKQNISQGVLQIPLVATLRGFIKTLEMPKYENTKEVNVTLEMAVCFYKFEYNYKQELLIDIDNMLCFINGIDILAPAKLNLL